MKTMDKATTLAEHPTIRPPRYRTVIVRGLGYGTLWGLIAGFFVPMIAWIMHGALADETVLGGIILAPFGAAFGALFGMVAGLAAATAFAPFAAMPSAKLAARAIAATVGPAVVALISGSMFPTADALMLFVLPCLAAVIAGLFFGAVLARPELESS